MPDDVIKYIVDLYSKLTGTLISEEWSSVPFRFRRGVFQGEPYSPIIFLISFNLLIQYLKTFEEQYGYKMTIKDDNNELIKSQRIITTPFKDNFKLLTGHKLRHQKLQDDFI